VHRPQIHQRFVDKRSDLARLILREAPARLCDLNIYAATGRWPCSLLGELARASRALTVGGAHRKAQNYFNPFLRKFSAVVSGRPLLQFEVAADLKI
jgi:hypothetical protein